MKSKAQEFAEAATRVQDFTLAGWHLSVTRTGNMLCCTCQSITNPKDALKLRDWLTNTFDVPKIPGRQPGWSRED